ncbi:hypothetical protein AMEX_G15809 [Astyanax mexicanus]|uniref:Uncharacterized protein n=1 Tax=Astyanax mexicanus TaxID=7994 RepID=A0A8T2LIY8_ASTMX|nr:hypothetical protein AMEX_G15809 [Astyanax mexicanus]
MAVYLVCDVLFFLYHLVVGCEKLENTIKKVASPESCWQVSFSISTLLNVAFTLALIIGVCLCQPCLKCSEDWASKYLIIVTPFSYVDASTC